MWRVLCCWSRLAEISENVTSIEEKLVEHAFSDAVCCSSQFNSHLTQTRLDFSVWAAGALCVCLSGNFLRMREIVWKVLKHVS